MLKHRAELDKLRDDDEKHHRLCELNVIEQVVNVSQTTVVRDAWSRGQKLEVHGLIYALDDGLLHNLDVSVTTTPVAPVPAETIRARARG